MRESARDDELGESKQGRDEGAQRAVRVTRARLRVRVSSEDERGDSEDDGD